MAFVSSMVVLVMGSEFAMLGVSPVGRGCCAKVERRIGGHKMFDINVLGLLLVAPAASAHLGEGGNIINIGSGVTAITPPQTAVYTASKGAVDAITGVLARELGPRKI